MSSFVYPSDTKNHQSDFNAHSLPSSQDERPLMSLYCRTAVLSKQCILFLSLLWPCYAVLGRIGLDFLSSMYGLKRSYFGNLEEWMFLAWGMLQFIGHSAESMASFIGHFHFLSVLPVGPIVFGNSGIKTAKLWMNGKI